MSGYGAPQLDNSSFNPELGYETVLDGYLVRLGLLPTITLY
jgi:hypothetical protein